MTDILIFLGLVAITCFGVWLAVRGATARGAAEEREAATRDALDAVKKANDASVDVGGLAPDERRRRLQRWSRG